MPNAYGLTVKSSMNVGAWVARTTELFREMIGRPDEVVDTVFHDRIFIGPPYESPAVPIDRYGEFEVGFGRPGFSVDFETSEHGTAGALALPEYDTPDSSSTSILVGPGNNMAVSKLLAACALIAAGELTGGVIDDGAARFVGEPVTDAHRLAAVLRRSALEGAGLEERATSRLRELPGFRHLDERVTLPNAD